MPKDLIFTGSGVAIITPMLDDSQINYDKFDELIEYQINNNTDAIIVAGTTGESSTLSKEEYITLISRAVEKTNGRIPVIAGSGSNSTFSAIWMSQQAKIAGADGLLIVTPYYNKTTQTGIIKHYFAIAESVPLPIIVYNVPSRTGLNILPETYFELSKHPNIVAVKEANGDISSIAKTISLCNNNLHVYSGNDDQIVPTLSLGGKGIISVAANILPWEIHQICELFFSNKITESAELQLKFLPLINIIFSTVNPIGIKQAMNILGQNVGYGRLPLVPMDEALSEKLKTVLSSYDMFKDI